MRREQAIAVIGRARVVAILRGDFRETAEAVADALFAGGLRCVEVSLTSTHALRVMERVARRAPADAVVGAGTVRSAKDCRLAADYGARLVVSPHIDPELVSVARDLGLVTIPGALTPTEIATALDAGADAVKLFPADWVGPERVGAVLAPFPGLRLVPTGGVSLDAGRGYLTAGAWAIGVGGPLVGTDASAAGVAQIEARAREFAALAAAVPLGGPA